MIIILCYFLKISLSFFTDIDKIMFEENWNYSFLYVIFLTIISLDIYFAFIFDRMKRRAVYENPANYLRRARSEVQFFSARKTALHVYFLLFLSFLFPLWNQPSLKERTERRTTSATKRNLLRGWNNEGSFSIDGCISEKTLFFLSFFLSWWEIISWNHAGSLDYRWKFETFFFFLCLSNWEYGCIYSDKKRRENIWLLIRSAISLRHWSMNWLERKDKVLFSRILVSANFSSPNFYASKHRTTLFPLINWIL